MSQKQESGLLALCELSCLLSGARIIMIHIWTLCCLSPSLVRKWRPTPWWRYDDSRNNRWQKQSSVAVGVGGEEYSFYSVPNFSGKCKEEEIRGTFQLVQMSMTSAQLPVTSLQRFLTSLQLSMKSSTAVHNNLFKNDFWVWIPLSEDKPDTCGESL